MLLSDIPDPNAAARRTVALRRDVEGLRSTGQSLMPEGLERSVTVEQMADLIAFLKGRRHLDPGK